MPQCTWSLVLVFSSHSRSSEQLKWTTAQGLDGNFAVQKPQEVDPRFEGHCSLVTLVRPDHTRHLVRALRDTGALQSLMSQQSVADCDYDSTGEFRLIRGVTGETVSVPLVRVTLQSSLCSSRFLCGLPHLCRLASTCC